MIRERKAPRSGKLTHADRARQRPENGTRSPNRSMKREAVGRRTLRSSEGAAVTRLILAVFRLNGRLIEAGDRLTAPFGLSSARWQVLGPIEQGPMTVAKIARAMGLRRQSVQRLVGALAADGFVELTANPAHRRAPLVALRERGLAALTKINAIQAAWANGLAVPFTARRIAEAAQLVETLADRLAAGSRITQQQ